MNTDTSVEISTEEISPMTGITAALATITAAHELRVGETEIELRMARSVWGSVQEMLVREFQGSYRGYYPKCGMHVRDEAAIAAVFDALAEITNDGRRALRVLSEELANG